MRFVSFTSGTNWETRRLSMRSALVGFGWCDFKRQGRGFCCPRAIDFEAVTIGEPVRTGRKRSVPILQTYALRPRRSTLGIEKQIINNLNQARVLFFRGNPP